MLSGSLEKEQLSGSQKWLIFACEKLGGADLRFKGSVNIMCNSDPSTWKRDCLELRSVDVQ